MYIVLRARTPSTDEGVFIVCLVLIEFVKDLIIEVGPWASVLIKFYWPPLLYTQLHIW